MSEVATDGKGPEWPIHLPGPKDDKSDRWRPWQTA